MPSILFVCTANQCRSPMATALLQRQLRKIDCSLDWRVESAGTWAHEGAPAARRVQSVMREWGLDVGRHRSRHVSRDLLSAFDLILVMSKGHREALQIEFPELAERVHLLSEMAGEDFDVPDPINGTLDDVRIVAKELDTLLAQGLERITSLTKLPRTPALRSSITKLLEDRRAA